MYLNTEFGLALGLLSSLGLASVTPARQISIAKPPPNNVCNGTVSSILKSQAHLFSSGAIIHDTPDSPGFFNATERWTTYEAPTYIAAITPATEQDVVQIVNLARKCNIPFLATGGRHGYTTTWSKLKNGLAIDLSQMRDLKVDKRAQTITVGPGIKIEDIFDPLWAAGLEMQSGSCPCPGLIGVTIGGGVGRYQGYYGLLIDDLVSARVITADGRILTASKTSNPDLFWAIRGAGANFGVVTSATFKAHPVQDQGDNFVAEFVIFPNQTQRYFQTIEAMQPLPAPLASIMLNMYNPEANDAQIAAQWVYKGSEAAARRALKPIFDLGLISTATFSVKWPNLVKSAFGGEGFINIICAENVNRDLVSWNMKKYTAKAWQETFVKLQKFYQDVPGGRNSVINYELFPNQAMAAVPDSETAYPLRDSTGYVNLNLLFDQADQVSAQSAIAFGNDMRTTMTSGGNNGYDELRVFVNYAHGDEKLEQIYGKNKLPKLSQLKKKYDPTQMFSFNNGIPLRYP